MIIKTTSEMNAMNFYRPQIGKALSAVALALLLNISVSAQKTQDVVYLHNGSMVRGQLIEKIEGSHVKIETADGSLWVFPMAEVKEVGTANTPARSKDFAQSPRGFYNLLDAGIMSGQSGDESIHSPSVHTIGGYRFNPHLAAGLGVGIENFEIPLAPVFAEGRYYVLKKGRFSPFVALQGGYAIPLKNYRDFENEWINKGGIMANANIGLRNYINSNLGLVVSAGFRHQQSVSKQVYWWFTDTDEASLIHRYNRFVFRIGLVFN